MKLRIIGIVEKKLIGRKDVEFEVEHSSEPTPSIWEIRNSLAAIAGFKIEGVLVTSIRGLTGKPLLKGVAHVYESEEEMRRWEPRHVVIANMEPSARRSAIQEISKKRAEAKAARTGAKK